MRARSSLHDVALRWAAVYRSLYERQEPLPTVDELAWAIVIGGHRVRYDAARKAAALAIDFAMTRQADRGEPE